MTRARPAAPAGLLDTSVVIALPRIADARVLPERCLLSAITLAELSVGPLATDDPGERAARQAVLQAAEATFDPLPFDPACARAFGGVAAALRATGARRRAHTFDALIAATAIAHGLPLITANARDVAGIPGLDVRELELTDAP